MSDPTTTYQDIERIWLTADGGIKAALRAMAEYLDGQRRPVEVTDAAVEALVAELRPIYSGGGSYLVNRLEAIARHVLASRQSKPEDLSGRLAAVLSQRNAFKADRDIANARIAALESERGAPTFESLRQLFWDRGIHGENGDDLAWEVVRMCEAREPDAVETLGERADLMTELDVANARIRVLEAEVATAKTEIERTEEKFIVERDNAEESFSRAFFIVTGRSPEWSNNWGYGAALDEIGDACTILRETAAQAAKLSPVGTIRLGEGLTEAQEGWTPNSKLASAAFMEKICDALGQIVWVTTVQGFDYWDQVNSSAGSMAAALRASAALKTEAVDWVKIAAECRAHPFAYDKDAIMAGLCEQIEALQAKVV